MTETNDTRSESQDIHYFALKPEGSIRHIACVKIAFNQTNPDHLLDAHFTIIPEESENLGQLLRSFRPIFLSSMRDAGLHRQYNTAQANDGTFALEIYAKKNEADINDPAIIKQQILAKCTDTLGLEPIPIPTVLVEYIQRNAACEHCRE